MDLTNQRILITGGAGFVGSHVSRSLLAEGAAVDIVDNLANGTQHLVPEAATFHELDLRDGAIQAVLSDTEPTVLLHLAAHHYIPFCNEHPEETFQVNVMGTRQLLSAARGVESLDRVVFASSAAVYPIDEGPHAEDQIPGPTDIYGQTKLVGEDLCKLFAAETGVPTAVARLFNIYGRHETNEHVVPAIVNQLQDGNRSIELGNLAPKRDFIHVADVARALMAMIADFDDEFRTYNIGTGNEYSVEELVEHIAAVLDEEITIAQGEHRVRDEDRMHLCADPTRAANELRWEAQVPLTIGLRDVLAEADLATGRPEAVRL